MRAIFRNLVVAVVVGVTASVAVLQVPAAAAPAYGGDVKRSIVINRAENWLDRHVPYDVGAFAWDINRGRQYRQDSSGFVSMTWKLTTSATTRTLGGYSHEIDWNDLLPGDALLNEGLHVCLFDAWVDEGTKADFWVYELRDAASDMRRHRVNVRSARSDGYRPMRYDHIVKG
ncbi:hypothetical protein [Actinoplanes sp. M2I2]|uniref:hypothetical protein n=1 Tax=Actinoplanes sp. M2I2 TaxID=1734444 RepID=UPI0020217B68|nr:hypothetical protein [Actinoplanes sp. M2I2]